MSSKHLSNDPQPTVFSPQQGSAQPPAYHHSPVYTPVPTAQSPYMNATTPHPIPINILRENPAFVHCPYCYTYGMTVTEHKLGLCTWLSVGALYFFSLGLCCWIPCCIDSCKDVEHRCSNCHNTLFVHKRI